MGCGVRIEHRGGDEQMFSREEIEPPGSQSGAELIWKCSNEWGCPDVVGGEMSRQRHDEGLAHSEFDEPQGSVAPLIDVSFLLLIFFLVSMTLMKKEQDLKTQLGRYGPPSDQPQLPVVVDVREGGEIALNPGIGETLVSMDIEDRELTVLQKHLETMVSVSGGDKMLVQLRAEDNAPHQRVVDVLNCFAAVGVTSVGFVDPM